ncbi:GreA/GreB family elongation factor [Methylacidiphilum caldifontis]|uniref:Transcription elongation factor GreA n=1 Tax=Methylacidiphilum caldifontis TaxID=2795386 RepID=A0A4Y8P7E0_9BACT|nr:GreA/GreB family elongation factor [Methylacidiphilum caldifontis]TFE65910.1 transcription elongation factor GreA [Methylacidiphilum caldifontis]
MTTEAFAIISNKENLEWEQNINSNNLTEGTYCLHKSWGLGKIRQIDENGGWLIVDFKGKPAHQMALDFAISSLLLLSADHLLVLKEEKLSYVQKLSLENPLELIKIFVFSFRDKATLERLQHVLCPDVIQAEQWKKWWENTKRILKKSAYIHIPSRKSEPFVILEKAQDHFASFMHTLGSNLSPRKKLESLNKILKEIEKWDDQSLALKAVSSIDELLNKPNIEPFPLLDFALLKVEIIQKAKIQSTQNTDLDLYTYIPERYESLLTSLLGLSSVNQEKVLQLIWERKNQPIDLFLSLLSEADGRLADNIVKILVEAGLTDLVLEQFNRLIRERTLSVELLYWLCKNKDQLFQPLFNIHLFYCILYVLERELGSVGKKAEKLYDLLTTGTELIYCLLSNASLDDIKDVTRTILLSPVFKELDKRSLLGAIVKITPEVQELISNNRGTEAESLLIVSWESLEQKKKELDELVRKKIPENSKDIAHARSYGDLRENHEYKAAKEMQVVLMRRKAELESMISRARATDFSNVDTSSVNIGTVVHFRDLKTNSTNSVAILGAWDSNPSKGIISYLAVLSQSLLGHKPGDIVQVSLDDGTQREIRVEKISRWNPKS